ERTRARADRARRANGARGAIERRQDTVAGPIDLAPIVARDLAPYPLLIAQQQIAPPRVTERLDPLGRTDDVPEEDGREHAIGGNCRLPRAREETLDLREDRLRVAQIRNVVRALDLHVASPWDPVGEVLPMFGAHVQIPTPMD